MKPLGRHLIAFWVTIALMVFVAASMVFAAANWFTGGGGGAPVYDNKTEFMITAAAYGMLITTLIILPIAWALDRLVPKLGALMLLIPVAILIIGAIAFSATAEGPDLNYKLGTNAGRWVFYPFFLTLYVGIIFVLRPKVGKKK